MESTFWTTLTAPLLVPTMREDGGDAVVEAGLTVFNAVTPLVPLAVDDELQNDRPLLLLVMAKQSAGLVLDMMSDPA